MTFVLAYITTKDKTEADKIGRMLLEKKLAACVNIVPGMHSMYWWEGKIESAEETVLLVKTESTRIDRVIALVKAMHSYQYPCVVTLPIESGNPAYLEWLEKSLS